MSSTENRDSPSPAWSGDDAEPRPLAADSVARKLREARTDAGHELDDVAHALRIRYDYLLAIEEGRFEDLPGPTYAVGFVRAYADYLKLDIEDIATRFKAEVADFTRRTELVFPSPEPETRIPGSLVFLVSAVLIAGAYGVWYFSSSGPDQVATPPRVDEVPAPPTAEAPAIGTSAPPPGIGLAELPEAPAGFVDPSDSDPASTRPLAPGPDTAPAEAGPSARVAGDDPAGTDAIGPTAPDAEVAATPEAVEAPPAEVPAQAAEAAQDAPPAPAEVGTEDLGEAVGGNDAPAEAAPPAAELAAAETPIEPAAAEDLRAEVPAEEAAAPAAEAPTGEAAASAENGTPDEPQDEARGEPQDTATVVAARGAETAETEVAADESQAEAEEAPSASPRQRDGVTIAPLPPQTPARRPLVQPEPVQTAELGEGEPEPAAVYGAVNGDSRIVVRAIYDSYVLIRDADDKLILTKVLRRGESYRVPDQQGLTMLTGNAGGLRIEVDGEVTPSVGAVGAIVRNINLDPARLKSGNATGP